jgi:hypothetical protein
VDKAKRHKEAKSEEELVQTILNRRKYKFGMCEWIWL